MAGGRAPRPLPVRRGTLRRRAALWADERSWLPADRVADVTDFLDAVERVADGGSAIDPEVVRQLLARTHRSDPLGRLTPRGREVLGLMAEGHSNGSIAERLVVSPGAVEKHISNIFMKFDLPVDDERYQRRVMAVVRYLNS